MSNERAMSKGFKDQTENNQRDIDAKANEKAVDATVVFFSRASACEIANFKPEVRAQSGGIISREVSLKFHDNIYTTHKINEIEFIRKSTSLECGDVRECKDMAEAQLFRAQQAELKSGVRSIKIQDIEQVHLTESGEVLSTERSVTAR